LIVIVPPRYGSSALDISPLCSVSGTVGKIKKQEKLR
jgi:hypothetical protein